MSRKTPRHLYVRKPDAPESAAEAFAEVRAEAANIPDDELARVTIKIPIVVSIALGALPNIMHYRSEIVRQLPHHPVEDLDQLARYAMAAWYAHLAYVNESVQLGSSMQPLLDEAIPLRQNLLVAAEALAHRGMLNADSLAEIRAGQGHVDTANDLVALAALFDASWNDIHNKTAVERHEVDRASMLGPELLVALSLRDKKPGPAFPFDDPAKVRAQCFTRFRDAYDSCRRAIVYLRWDEGDVDEIAPSLYAQGKHARGAGFPPEDPESETEPQVPDT